jgi:hypothetical protein
MKTIRDQSSLDEDGCGGRMGEGRESCGIEVERRVRAKE